MPINVNALLIPTLILLLGIVGAYLMHYLNNRNEMKSGKGKRKEK